MIKTTKYTAVRAALESLGFRRATVDGGHVFTHPATETVLLFPAKTATVTPQRIASLRRILVGRDVVTERQFDEAFGALPRETVA
jgi:hypothetical protein